MHETDKIIEAEQNIQDIAYKLKQMRDAATIIQDTQNKTAAIINAAENVIKSTEKFSFSCGEIIKKLNTTDLNKRFDTLQEVIGQITTIIDDQTKKTIDRLSTFEHKISQVEEALWEIDKYSKKRYTISVVLSIVTLVVVFVSFIVILF